MSALAKLGTLIWHFMSPHSHCWVPNHSICLCLLVQVALSGSLRFYTPLKCPYKHSLTSPLLTYKISHDMWEPTSKSGASIWRFIWLLIRTIPLYLRDRNYLMDLQSEASKSSEWQWTVCSIIHLVNNSLIFSGFRASPTKRTKQLVYVLECNIIICLTLTITYKGHNQSPKARERERLLLPLSLIVRRIHSLLRVVQGMYLYVWMATSC